VDVLVILLPECTFFMVTLNILDTVRTYCNTFIIVTNNIHAFFNNKVLTYDIMVMF